MTKNDLGNAERQGYRPIGASALRKFCGGRLRRRRLCWFSNLLRNFRRFRPGGRFLPRRLPRMGLMAWPEIFLDKRKPSRVTITTNVRCKYLAPSPLPAVGRKPGKSAIAARKRQMESRPEFSPRPFRKKRPRTRIRKLQKRIGERHTPDNGLLRTFRSRPAARRSAGDKTTQKQSIAVPRSFGTPPRKIFFIPLCAGSRLAGPDIQQ